MIPRSLLGILLLVFSPHVLALAQTPPKQPPKKQIQLGDFKDIDELNLDDLLDLTVSIAAGHVQNLEEAPGIVSVISAEDMRRIGAQTLEDVLRIVPGFEVLTNRLGRSRISVRGVVTEGTSENVLILFNGHRLNEQMNGGATVANLDIPVYNLKQIEIIRGPGSALFGSNAFVGVINLVPHTAESFDGMEVSLLGGSFGTQQYSVLSSQVIGGLGISTAFQFRNTDGPKLLIPADSQTTIDNLFAFFNFPPVSLAPGNTRDNRRSEDFSLNAVYKGFTLDARIRNQKSGGYIGKVDILGKGNELRNRQVLLAADQRLALGKQLDLTARFEFTQNEDHEVLNSLPPGFTRILPDGSLAIFSDGIFSDFSHNTRRFAGNVIFDFRMSDTHQLTFGTGIEREATFGLRNLGNFDILTGGPLDSLQPVPLFIPPSSRRIFSLFAQDSWDVSPSLGITAGLRFEDYSDFGGTLNPRLALVWRLPKSFHFKALYGRAFRAPTFTELFVDLPNVLVGDPNLRPATINTLEFSLGYKKKNWRVSGNYFANFIRDFIVGSKTILLGALGSAAQFSNSPGLNIQGVELEVQHRFGFDNSLFLNYTYQRPKERGTGIRFADAPSHLANLGFTLGLSRYVAISPTVSMRGRRPRVAIDPRNSVAAYALLNLNIRLKNVFETLELSGTINNVFDKQYFDPSPLATVPGDYPRAGRDAYFRLSYKF